MAEKQDEHVLEIHDSYISMQEFCNRIDERRKARDNEQDEQEG